MKKMKWEDFPNDSYYYFFSFVVTFVFTLLSFNFFLSFTNFHFILIYFILFIPMHLLEYKDVYDFVVLAVSFRTIYLFSIVVIPSIIFDYFFKINLLIKCLIYLFYNSPPTYMATINRVSVYWK